MPRTLRVPHLAFAAVVAMGRADPAPAYDPALHDELVALAAGDQGVRQGLTAQLTDAQRGAMAAVDAKDEARMKAIIARCGWPARSLVGEDGAHDAWLLVQHCRREFEETCLPLMEKAVDEKEASGTDYAYLLDRVRMYEGKPQVYGTQFQDNALYPIEDAGHVDERRRSVDLGPEADYVATVRRIYRIPDPSPAPPAGRPSP